MKVFRWIYEHLLFVVTIVLLAFIPLYPKIPLLDVGNTWVYVRVEDFLVVLAIISWTILLVLKKITLKTPLTLPILLFWIIGGVSTLHGVLILFPTLANVFSNVAFLSLLRRIEYMSLFFIAYSAIKEKKFILYTVYALAIILLLIVGYGFGQKFFGFPAYLTMNEEFAKGIPLQLSQLGRIPSTFAGHYDLAAYLVLVVPIFVSIAFGLRNWLMKSFFLTTAGLGFALLFMTVSRVSFFVLIISLVTLFIFQKKKIAFVLLLVMTALFLIISPRLLERFGSTVTEIDILVDTKTGEAIGQVKDVSNQYFKDKLVVRELGVANLKTASISAIVIPYTHIPSRASLVIEPNSPNGENLPQGTSYINLPLAPVVKKVNRYYFEKSDTKVNVGSKSAEILVYDGDFLVKKAKAYDLSFTTRFQGEWPNTLKAFGRNIFLGSGYGSVSLAVDNDFLRILGETGLLGFVSFFAIFLIAGIYIARILPKIDSPLIRSFVFGFVIGAFGLLLNATLIDVFEASKVAFTFWLLMGITLGVLRLYSSQDIDFYKEFRKAVTSSFAIIVYIFIVTFVLFSGILSNYFVGDDYTWFRWIADCKNCNFLGTIFDYFTNSNGFFYRPGTKVYFLLMYKAFWLNQTMYHLVSLILNFFVVVLIFLVSKRIFRNNLLSFGTSMIFAFLASHHEVIFWISSTGFLFNAVFALLALLFFIYWKEKGRKIFLLGSVISITLSLLFHEIGVIVPLTIILYDIVYGEKSVVGKLLSKKIQYFILLFPILPYFTIRLFAQSHWLSGDYNYSIVKLPFNIAGNLMGYITLSLLGPSSLSIYEKLRVFSKDNIMLAILGSILVVVIFVLVYRLIFRGIAGEEKKVIIFGSLFLTISLLPFLGLGNITSRYNYLSSFGFAVIIVLFLKKFYEYLLGNGKHIALGVVVLFVIIFSSTQLFQFQRIQTDWREAGKKSNNFLTSLDWIYAHYSTEETSKLYFVDVPIRHGEAWVFPVGLSDAAWLVFRDKNIKVYQAGSVEEAFESLGTANGSIFKFDGSGNLIKFIKTYNGEIISEVQ